MATGHAPNAGPGEDFKRLGKLMLLGFRAGPKRHRKFLIVQCLCFGFFIVFWIRFNGGLLPHFLLSQFQSTNVSPDVDVLEHFQQAESDGSRITWIHAINSKSLLQKALNSETMMLEADVVLKGQGTQQQQLVAVMAHPPAVDSDLTIEEWLQLSAPSGKGIKLDFKSIEAVEISLQKLQSLKTQLTGPVYLSANILDGPNTDAADKAVDPHRFLRLCNEVFPHSTISLGWTTGPVASGVARQYSWADVKNMHDLVEKWELKQPLTFSVRAALVKNSLAQLKWLTEMTGGTLTVWASPQDEVPVSDLLLLRHKFPKHKVLYDLHEALQLQFQPVRDEADTRLGDDEKAQATALFKADMWKVVKTKDGEMIYLGNEAVLLQKGLLVTREMHPSPFTVEGRFEFLPVAGHDFGDSEPGLEIFVLVTQSSRPDTLSGIKCFIGASGTTRLSTQGMPGVDRKVEGSIPGGTACYRLTLTNKDQSHLIMTVMRQKVCGSHSTANDGENMLQLSMAGITQGAGHVAIKTVAGNMFVAIDHFAIGGA